MNGIQIDPRAALNLAWALIAALAQLLHMTKHLNSRQLPPSITSDSVTLIGDIETAHDLFDSIEALMARLGLAAALLDAAEKLLQNSLCDRMTLPNMRLPIPVNHDGQLDELLSYDAETDAIQCQVANASELVEEHFHVLEAMANIAANGLIPRLEVDGTAVTFPTVSASILDHGRGAGHTIVSTCRISGLHLVAGEVEVRIEGFRDERVFRAHLSDAARLAAILSRPPFTAAIEFSEVFFLLPLLPHRNGKVVIERIWDIEEQTQFDFSYLGSSGTRVGESGAKILR
ncbi:MAG: hypothetical protein LKM32_14205 [Chiayiivirga sp.]|jgi:hypothetical protein|uniref:hypothetical protein n=1 Tax=Chiayiivirga sp. TaxID=2041042 RepID=UPI0025C4CCB8|nr:hypothetical protein [Chiayiivirga sp.]MCI1730483.1 hypothetical protein [Chiayiivirga sp.]